MFRSSYKKESFERASQVVNSNLSLRQKVRQLNSLSEGISDTKLKEQILGLIEAAIATTPFDSRGGSDDQI